jgi:hypothetical protein
MYSRWRLSSSLAWLFRSRPISTAIIADAPAISPSSNSVTNGTSYVLKRIASNGGDNQGLHHTSLSAGQWGQGCDRGSDDKHD